MGLKPFYKAGSITKELYKSIAKRSTEKVVGSICAHIGVLVQDEDAIEAFLDDNQRRKIALLVGDMVEYTIANGDNAFNLELLD